MEAASSGVLKKEAKGTWALASAKDDERVDDVGLNVFDSRSRYGGIVDEDFGICASQKSLVLRVDYP